MNANWNVDVKKLQAQQDELKNKMNFAYVGHGPKATGFMSKEFKRKPGLYARCTQCGYYMPLNAQGQETWICGGLMRTQTELKCEYGKNEVEIFKAAQK